VSDNFGIGVIVGIVLTMLCCLAGIGLSVLFPRRPKKEDGAAGTASIASLCRKKCHKKAARRINE
jgi:hypothetical protein